MKRGRVRKPFSKMLRNMLASGHRAKTMTKKRLGQDLEIKITEKELEEVFVHQESKCFWFNIKLNLDWLYEKWHPLAPSVDRLDETKGYLKDNIVICARIANLGRQKCDLNKFRSIIDHIKNEIKNEI